MRPRVFIFAALLVVCPQTPVRADAISEALSDAIAAFDRARPHLPQRWSGVDVKAYGDALSHGQFMSAHWDGPMVLDLHESTDSGGSCARYAAYVSLPPQGGTVRLTICPQFSAEGTRSLRRLTVLHEMVHVVAGPDECLAMAFAAHVEQAATGAFTPVTNYWRANDCAASGLDLP